MLVPRGYNEGLDPVDKPENVVGKYLSCLWDKEIQVWLTGREKSSSLRFIAKLKKCMERSCI